MKKPTPTNHSKKKDFIDTDLFLFIIIFIAGLISIFILH